MPDARRCGSCTACCPLMDHLKAELGEDRRPCGCRPFPGRKAGCGGFVCLWLDGFGEPSDRPDKLGVVLKAVEDPDGPIAMAWEVRVGAATEPRPFQLIQRIAARLPTVVLQRPPDRATGRRVAPRLRARGRLGMLSDRIPRRRGGR